MPRCEHFDGLEIREIPAGTLSCRACLRVGDGWVHLRMCLECGHIGCCDSSKNQHARGHQMNAGHNVIRSAEPGEDWAYCFVHDEFAT